MKFSTGHGVHEPPKHSEKCKEPGSQSPLRRVSVSINCPGIANTRGGKVDERLSGAGGEGTGSDCVRVQAFLSV